MATSRNKQGGSSPLRIVWIPGKKKQPKGTYNPTKKGNTSPYHQQKKIEPWSLGGTKGQEDLLKAEIPGSDMASTSIVNCLPQTIGIGAACGDVTKPEGAEAAVKGENGHLNGNLEESDADPATALTLNIPPQPLSPRLGPLANIDEDEHENDVEDEKKDDYCGASSNTATLLLKDRRMNKFILAEKDEKHPITADDVDDELKKDPEKCKEDMADGVPRMRGLNRKLDLERRNRDKAKDIQQERDDQEVDDKIKKLKKDKDKKKTGMNEKAVDCLYVGLMCCECVIQ